jgi:hypothetical protein
MFLLISLPFSGANSMPTTTPAAAAPTKPKMILDFVLMIVFVLRLANALQNRLNNRTKTAVSCFEMQVKTRE